eukprot:1742412-Amphidinium_carterae.1
MGKNQSPYFAADASDATAPRKRARTAFQIPKTAASVATDGGTVAKEQPLANSPSKFGGLKASSRSTVLDVDDIDEQQ